MHLDLWRWRCFEANWCFTSFFNLIWLYMAVSFHSWRNKLFLGVNQHPSVSNWQLPLIGFERKPQRREATEAPFCDGNAFIHICITEQLLNGWQVLCYCVTVAGVLRCFKQYLSQNTTMACLLHCDVISLGLYYWGYNTGVTILGL